MSRRNNNKSDNYKKANVNPALLPSNVNNLLQHVNIKINIEKNYEIYYYSYTDKVNINNEEIWNSINIASGYQKFIINLVFTLVIWKKCNIVVPDIIIIDEGFDCCDEQNIKLVIDFILYLLHNHNDLIPNIFLIISHIKKLNEMIEYPLFIKNNKIENVL